TAYAIISSIGFIFLLLSFTKSDRRLNADEITVKKINITGEDGSLRMVLSNENRQHPGRMEGKDLPKRQRPAGIIFFNNQGDECGGIISGVTNENGGLNNDMSFTMDNYHDDQVVQLLNNEIYKNGEPLITRGLAFNEYPSGTSLLTRYSKFQELEHIKDSATRNQKTKELMEKEASKRRVFIGRNPDQTTGLFLFDKKGKAKIKIYVDNQGQPRIETLDENGTAKKLLLQ
ncbi:MAG: hypothetical protein J7539_13275, partial [Niabella sp.]|nr:hypothetical protein [Niabella sp.]